MAVVQPYFEFAKRFAPLSEEAFTERVTRPHLYFPNLPELAPEEHFRTIRLVPGAAPPDIGLQGILAVDKAESNAFGMMITLGRAANNDLVVPDQRVSKFHAYLRRQGDTWTLTDANSTNGTRVDGVPVPPHQGVPLRSGAQIELSQAIEILFLEPPELYSKVLEARAWATA